MYHALSMQRGLYIGWLGHRNLGDEAMFEACEHLFPEVRWSPVERIVSKTCPSGARWDRLLHGAARLMGREVGVLGGGTLLNRNEGWLHAYRAVRKRLSRPIPVLSPGVADPEYWTRDASWKDIRAEWRRELDELPVVGVRGPRSLKLLQEAGFKNVRVTGDPALWFANGSRPRGAAKGVVGFNVGRSNGRVWGSEDQLLAELSAAATTCKAMGMEVRVAPVWTEDEEVCRRFSEESGLSSNAVAPVLDRTQAYLAWVQEVDLVITVKLHAAVLAAAAFVPFIAVEYRPKVLDFTESVNWGMWTIRSDKVHRELVVGLVKDLQRRLGDEAERLRSTVLPLKSELVNYANEIRAYLA
jgi:polysaccharide pyruvyl transferase WcaK-like protein